MTRGFVEMKAPLAAEIYGALDIVELALCLLFPEESCGMS